MEYKDMSFLDLFNLAKDSSAEIGAMENGGLIDYEVGTLVKFTDKQTALFLASARGIVLELCRRLEPFVRAYGNNAGNWKDCDDLLIYMGVAHLLEQLWLDEDMHEPLTGKHLREAGMITSDGDDQ